ncbi:thioredoxin family protein [Candidatus Zixiibacteriota bacterium]
MALLNEQIRSQVQKELQTLTKKVKLIVFTQQIECPTCAQNTSLAQEVASLSDLIELETYNFQIDKEKAEQYGVDKIPAMVVEGDKDYGIRFYGVPGGYEFTSLLEAIKNVSSGKHDLSESTLQQISALSQPLHIQVFATPT